MATRLRPIKTNFTNGEVDPLITMRSDLELFVNGAAKMRNVLPFPQGGFRRRDGLEHAIQIPPTPQVKPIGVVNVNRSPNAAGVNYVVGDVLTISGGTGTSATIKVDKILASTGEITDFHLNSSGDYTVAPTSPASATGGSGSGASFAFSTETQDIVQLVDFTFSVDQNYLIVFTVSRFYIFRKENTGSGANQLVFQGLHPYSNDQLKLMTWTQSLDLMVIIHEKFPPLSLSRFGENDWTLTDFEITNPPSFAFGVTQTSTLTVNIGANPKIGDQITISVDVVTPNFSVLGNFIRVFGSPNAEGIDTSSYYKIVGDIAALSVTAEILTLPLITSTPFTVNGVSWLAEEPEWGHATDVAADRGYPRCGTFFQGRFCLAGSTGRPNTLWTSRAGDIHDFNNGGVAADLGIAITADSGDISTFQNIYPGRHLQLFADSSEFYVPVSELEPITPTTASLRRTSSVGSITGIPVFEVDGVVYFVQRGGQSFRQFLFVDNEKAYSTDIISLFSSHLINNPEDAAFKKSLNTEDGNYIWLVNSDGSMAIFSILRSELINAWALATTSGQFRHVAVLDQSTYFHLRRDIGITDSIAYTGNSTDISGQETSPRNIAFSNDGMKMFEVGTDSDSVHEYNLTTAFDFTDGVVFSGNSFDLSGQTTLPSCIIFNDVGTKMFIVGNENKTIFEYDLTTPFSIASGVTYSGESFSPSELTVVSCFNFNADGTRMLITGTVEDTIYEYTIGTAYDFSTTITYTGNNYNYSSEAGFVTGMTFNSAGTIMFLFDQTANDIFKYTLSVGFDLSSTITYTTETFNLASVDANGRSFVLKPDGTKGWYVGDTLNATYQFNMSPAFSLLPGVIDSGNSFLLSGQSTLPIGMRWNDDGTKFFVIDQTLATLFEYTVSVAFDLSSTVAYSGNSVSLSGENADPQGLAFNSDGTKFIVVGAANAAVFEYTLSVGFDLSSTFAYTGNTFSVSSEETGPRFVIWNGDGTRFYIAGNINDTIFEYTVSVAYDLSSVVAFSGNSFSIGSEAAVVRQMDFNSTGSKFFILDGQTDTVFEYTCSTPYSMLGAAYSGLSFSVTTVSSTPSMMGVSNDGFKLFVGGFSTDTLFEFDMNFAFSLTSDIVFSGEQFVFSGEDTNFTGMAFNDDGTKVFMVGDLTDELYAYNVLTPYDLAGGIFYSGNSFPIGQDGSPGGITFNDDGTKFFIIGGSTATLYEYDLTTPYSLASGVSYSGESFLVSAEETTPKAIQFNDDGTKFFILGAANNTVYEYTLSVAYDLSSTVNYSGNSFSVVGEENSCTSLRFNDDGTKFFILGITEDTLFEYTLTTAYSLASGVVFTGNNFDVSSEETLPHDFIFNPTGTEMNLIGNANTTLFGYVLTVPFRLNNFFEGDFIEIFNPDLKFDGGVIVTGLTSPVTSVAGLDFLEQETVEMIIDGVFRGEATVVNNVLIFPVTAQESYQFGLPFPQLEGEEDGVNVLVQTLPADVLLPEGTTMGRKKRIPSCTVRVADTQGFYLQNIFMPFGGSPPVLGTLIEPESGNFELKGLLGWDEFGQIKITQKEPLDMTVLGLAYDLSTG